MSRPFKEVFRDYVDISKPRIIFLLLIVAWAAMFVASVGLPPLLPFLGVTAAGILSTASSGAFNHVLERGRDARMARTASRPVASGRIAVPAALTYATVAGALSILSLGVLDLWLAAALTGGAILYYVIVYTVILKPTTTQNIVVGGLAGSFPAVIGWAAVTGTIGVPALILAGIVFVWTPAHFWALAILYKDDYAAADYPMMPVVHGEKVTLQQIVAYSVLTALASVALVAVGAAGWIYLVAAVALGGVLILRSVRLLGDPSPGRSRAFFFWTIQYLGVLFVVLMADRLVAFPVV